jgi:ribosome-associated heat shock protein Hsp15
METTKIRVDKWLWSVRIFKTRTQATDACKRNNVKIKSKAVKPSALISPDEIIEVHKNGFNLTFKVLKLISKRVGSPIAVTCYENLTPESEMNKYSDWFVGKGRPEMREKGTGRPTKRERREIDIYKDRIFWDEEEFD